MLISTETGSFEKYGDNKKIIKMLKDSGFTGYDFTMCHANKNALVENDDYIEKATELGAYAEKIGIKCNQTHAPFPSVKIGDGEYNEKAFSLICRAIEISGILGARGCVVHPCNNYTVSENAEFYNSLKDVALKNRVKIYIENMWNWDKKANKAVEAACSDSKYYKELLDMLDKRVFSACLDIGHAEMMGDSGRAVDIILALRGRLKALHIHDNGGHYDNHNLPYTNSIDFNKILLALKEIRYSGDITFESTNFVSRLPCELYPSGARFMYSIGKYFRGVILK